jgi:hypothetical protein
VLKVLWQERERTVIIYALAINISISIISLPRFFATMLSISTNVVTIVAEVESTPIES